MKSKLEFVIMIMTFLGTCVSGSIYVTETRSMAKSNQAMIAINKAESDKRFDDHKIDHIRNDMIINGKLDEIISIINKLNINNATLATEVMIVKEDIKFLKKRIR